MRTAGVIVAVTALLFAACGTDEAPEAAGPTSIDVRAANYKFAAPASVEAGAVEITMENAGPEPHQVQLFRLNDRVDAAQVIAAAKKDGSGLGVAKLGAYAGGPNATDAGETQVATVALEAGNYVFLCLVPDAKGRAHAGLGMVKALDVTDSAETAQVPEADYQVSTTEFDFTMPDAWSGTFTFTNDGEQDHEYQVMEIAKGKTAKDFEAFFRAPPGQEPAGPPPWTTGGGGAVIEPGSSQTFELDLAPGTYFLMCFVADPQKKAPHFALGMMKQFRVS